MTTKDFKSASDRRRFLGSLVSGAAVAGLATFTPSLNLHAQEGTNDFVNADDPDEWFKKIKGRHRIVYDVTHPNEIFPFAWPRVFLLTNEKTGTPAKDCSVVVVLRHTGIPFAFENRIWEKYKLGELFKIDDPLTKAPAIRNTFWEPKPGEYKIPGIGNVEIGINELQASGVMFCICDMAATVFSARAAAGMKLDETVVKKDWIAGLLPGVQIVPSGVWAVGRAQEHGCAYCFVG